MQIGTHLLSVLGMYWSNYTTGGTFKKPNFFFQIQDFEWLTSQKCYFTISILHNLEGMRTPYHLVVDSELEIFTDMGSAYIYCKLPVRLKISNESDK